MTFRDPKRKWLSAAVAVFTLSVFTPSLISFSESLLGVAFPVFIYEIRLIWALIIILSSFLTILLFIIYYLDVNKNFKIGTKDIYGEEDLSIASLKSDVHGDEEKLNEFIDKAAKEVIRRASANIKKKISEESTDSYINEALHEVSVKFESMKRRLLDEIERISLRGNLNLATGVAISIVGLGILTFFIFQFTIQMKSDGVNANIIFSSDSVFTQASRISLVLVMEVLAYFFLRIYKSSIDDIKYIQNEITNIEYRHISVYLCYSSLDQEGFSSVIKSFMADERNFILSKGQTTVEIEKARLENSHWEALTKLVASGAASATGNGPKKKK